MALFTEYEVRNRARVEVSKRNFTMDSAQIVLESLKAYSPYKTYDIFLSHSIKDAELILGMKGILEDMGYSVYVDWIEDPQLDRSSVTEKTAQKLTERMRTSKSLFYVTTDNSSQSKWMPWECGYFDGYKEKVAIVPIKPSSSSNRYSGQEYLGLYPYCIRQNSNDGISMLWILKDENTYIDYDTWVKTPSKQLSWKRG